MNVIKVKTEEQKLLFFSLMDEFGSRVIKPRNRKVETSHLHFGIGEVETDLYGITYYEVYLPQHYIDFINYLLEKRSLLSV